MKLSRVFEIAARRTHRKHRGCCSALSEHPDWVERNEARSFFGALFRPRSRIEPAYWWHSPHAVGLFTPTHDKIREKVRLAKEARILALLLAAEIAKDSGL